MALLRATLVRYPAFPIVAMTATSLFRILKMAVLAAVAPAAACSCSAREPQSAGDDFAPQREQMVSQQIAGADRGIRDEKVLRAMRQVPRHEFVPENVRGEAYADRPLPIGHGQTISQPFIVAFMTEKLALQPDHKVLEIGTGSGYQAAVLSVLAKEIYTIEIVEPLGRQAEQKLRRLGYNNVHVRVGDGYKGWPEAAPFDAIMVTCAPEAVPKPLVDQLKVGGRMIIPVGSFAQELHILEKKEGGLQQKAVLPVRFVPMTGEAQRKP